jgi:hypothetical protein
MKSFLYIKYRFIKVSSILLLSLSLLFTSLQFPFQAFATGQTYVQSGSFSTGSKVTSQTQTLSGAVASGDLLVGVFSQYDSSGNVSVSDNVNGSWTRASNEHFSNGGGDIAVYYLANSKASPSGITVTVSAANATYLGGAVSEYSGLAASSVLDSSVCGEGNSTSADSGATSSVNQGDLIFGGLQTGGNPNGVSAGSSQGVNFTKRATNGTGSSTNEDILSGNAGTQNAKFTLTNSTDWYSCAAAFKPLQPITFVQGAANSPGTQASSETINFSQPVTAGDLLVGWFAQYNASGQVSVSDNINGSWMRGPNETFANGGGDIALYYKVNSAASSSGLTITASANSSTYLPYAVAEYSGVATSSALDQTAIAYEPSSANSSTVVAGPTASVGAGDLVFGGEITGGIPSSFTVGSSQGINFTKRETNFDSGSAGVEDILSSAPGGQSSSFTLSSSTDWYSVIATFKP